MLARLEGRRLKLPLPTIGGGHQQTRGFQCAVETLIHDTYIEVLAPFRAVVDRKLQFHMTYFGTKIQKKGKSKKVKR